MNRRRYLASVAGVFAAAAGCLAAPGASDPDPTPTSVAGVDLPVPRDEIYPAVHASIPAIVEPAFAPDWEGIEIDAGATTYRPRLRPGDPVVGVERGGRARAYPLGVLQRHEVVNDALGGPLLVTYCPLCGSAVTAVRRVGGREAVFTVSHLLWRSNLVVRDDRTGSLWSQILAAAIRGPATGERLELVPSSLETWGVWRGTYPDTEVLLPPPHSGTVFGNPSTAYEYDRYRDSASVVGREGDPDRRTLVMGVRIGGEARAYPFGAVSERGAVNDAVGGVPVVVASTPDGSLVAFRRIVGGRVLRFESAGGAFLRAGGSRWLRARGVAVDGPHEGVGLSRANDLPPMFWSAWRDFHPDTDVYGSDPDGPPRGRLPSYGRP